MILKTERLELISGTLEHARAEKYNLQKLSELLNSKIPDNWPPPLNDEQSMNYFLKFAEENPDAGGFTFWYIILTEEESRKTIGNIGFKGMPGKDGTVEIGYSIMETHQSKGFAPEAVKEIVKWTFSQPNVTRIIAETLHDGLPSQKVLIKNGFKLLGDGSEPGILRYELQKKDYSAVSV